MDNISLSKKYEKLLDLARRMRGWQREYNKYHSSEAKKRMLELQRQIDRLLQEEEKELKSGQKELF